MFDQLNKLPLHIPGNQGIEDWRKEAFYTNLALKYKANNIVINGFNHVIEFGDTWTTLRIQQGEMIQDGCRLFLNRTANFHFADLNTFDPSGYLVTYVQFNNDGDDWVYDEKFKIGVSYVDNTGHVVGPHPWNHQKNLTILGIFKFNKDVEDNIASVYEYSSNKLEIEGQEYYVKGWEPREESTGTGTGDMLKSVYDTNNNNIVDKAESLNDGLGNQVTALEVRNFLNNPPVSGPEIDDSGLFIDKVWSSEKINQELSGITAGSVEWANIDNKPTSFNPDAHTHEISHTNNLQNALDGKAPVVHTHGWDNINDKPTSFNPETHNHQISEVTGLQSELNNRSLITHDHDSRYPVLDGDSKIPMHYIPVEFKETIIVDNIVQRDALPDLYESLRVHVLDATDDPEVAVGGAGYIYHNGGWVRTYSEESLNVSQEWADIQNKPTTFPPDTHTHLEAQITDLDKYTQSEVNGLLNTKANIIHIHDWAEIDNKPLTFAPTLHNHTISEITNLQSELLNRSLVGHDHDWSEIDNKPTEFNPIDHTHALYVEKSLNLSDLANRQLALNTLTNVSSATTGQILLKDGTGNVSWGDNTGTPITNKIVGDEYLLKFGPGATINDRLNHPDTVIPAGWTVYQGDDIANVDGNLGNGADNLVIEHNIPNVFMCIAQVTERRASGPPSALGIVKVNYSSITIEWKSTVDMTQIGFMSYNHAVQTACESYIYMKLTQIPS